MKNKLNRKYFVFFVLIYRQKRQKNVYKVSIWYFYSVLDVKDTRSLGNGMLLFGT